jgi:MYXO-CTERM domain-containing protein
VNAAGEVAGVQYVNGASYATLWTAEGAKTLAGAGSAAMGINAGGQVTGMTASGHVLVSGANGEDVRDIGTVSGGLWSVGHAINDGGQVAGYGLVGGAFRGFRWSEDAGFSLLGTLGGMNSYGMAINDSGWVAGHTQTATGYLHAAVWTSTGAQSLGTLGGGNSFGYGINNSGWVVGYSMTSNGSTHAFLYADGVLYDLNSLLNAPAGWVLTHAYGINDSGQIVGEGMVDGQNRAFRLDLGSTATTYSLIPEEPTGPTVARRGVPAVTEVPEPSPWAMVLTGLVLFAAGRLRRDPAGKLKLTASH